MNKAGNVGPPRKLPSEIAQATPLSVTTRNRAHSDSESACDSSAPNESSPENSTASELWSVAASKTIASAATARPARGVSSQGFRPTTRADTVASSTTRKTPTAARTDNGTVQAKSTTVGLG